MKKIFFAIIFLSIFTFLRAQPIDLGFRLETQVLFNRTSLNAKESETSSLLTCGELTFGVYPTKNLLIEARFGYEPGLYFQGYKGTEYGIYAEYFLFKNLYLTAGIADHVNDGDGGYGESINITMPAVGLGYRPWSNAGIEVLYQKANNQKYSGFFDRNFPDGGYLIYLNHLLKISVFVKWTISD